MNNPSQYSPQPDNRKTPAENPQGATTPSPSAAAAAAATPATSSTAAAQAAPAAPLFERIGGRDGLRQLLRHFYADVRQHKQIGPIFNTHVTDWPAHIEVIADFWSGITGGPANYRGGMPYKHFPLGLEREHFEAWLMLWQRNCQQHLEPQAAEDMAEIAHTIGSRLHTMIERQKQQGRVF